MKLTSGRVDTPATPERIRRLWSFGNLLFWLLVLAFLLAAAPWPARLIGAAWALIGFAHPPFYLLTLGAALPWFGHNPGGLTVQGWSYLYLLESGLMGWVVRDQALRFWGHRPIRRTPANAWVRLLVAASAVTLYPSLKFLYCEAVVAQTDFLRRIYTHYATAPVFGLRAWLDLALAASLFAGLRDAPLAPAWRRRLWLTLLVTLLAASVVGVLEYSEVLTVGFWRGENPDIARFGYRRLQSLFWHSGWFAQYLAALAPMAAALGGLGAPAGSRRRWAWFGLAGFFAVTQLLTFQRAGWLGLAAGYGAVAVGLLAVTRSGGRRRTFIRLATAFLAAALLVAFLGLAIEPLGRRMLSLAAAEDRLRIWDAALRLARPRWLCGVGFGRFYSEHVARFLPGHPFHDLDKVTAHSLYLHLLAERGAIVLGVFLGLVVVTGRRVVQSLGRCLQVGSSRGWAQAEVLGLAGGLAALLVDGLFQYVFHVRLVEILFWLFLGLLFGPPEAAPAEVKPGRSRAPLVLSLLTLVVLLQHELAHHWWRWRLIYGTRIYRVGAAEVRLALPPEARRVAVPILCLDPTAQTQPVRFEFFVEGERLGSVDFSEVGATSPTLVLPPGRDPAALLHVRASRVWSPYRYGYVNLPILELGVSYQEPVAIED